MAKKILSVGYEIPGGEIESLPFRSNQSLLDADIIVFQPISGYFSSSKYLGKMSLDEEDSFNFVKDIRHWKTELEIASEAGKTIIVYLCWLQELFVKTGEKEYSGTGRNRAVTNLVRPANNYQALPFDLGTIIPKSGREIKIKKDLGPLARYWKDFSPYSSYQIYLQNPIEGTLLVTKTGDKTVGAIVTSGNGKFILLPTIEEQEDWYEENEEGDDEWTEEGTNFGRRLISTIVDLDANLRGEASETIAPEWVLASTYTLKAERALFRQVSNIDKKMEQLDLKKAELLQLAKQEAVLRCLLFEQGSALEEAIIHALKLLGFQAQRVKESDSEFDVVFSSPEGRFLGEAEGKNNKPINIDKLSQLERNIHEDFAHDDVMQYAKGVLFGNAFRLDPPPKRTGFFTEKCLSGAKRTGIAL